LHSFKGTSKNRSEREGGGNAAAHTGLPLAGESSRAVGFSRLPKLCAQVADVKCNKEHIMEQVSNIKNIRGKLNQRKPAQGSAKVHNDLRNHQKRKSTNDQPPEGRVGLMLDVNA